MDSDAPNTELGSVIHCGNLSMKTTHPELFSLFSQAAPVVKIVLKKDENTSKAYAFVTLKSEEDVKKVMEKFNYFTLHEKQMIITTLSAKASYLPEANIFVKNLPPMLTSKDLNSIFKAFGTVISCKVVTDDKGQSKGVGYVQYSSAKAASKAISTCKNAKIRGYLLEVMPYGKPIREAKPTSESSIPTFTNCFVKNFPINMSEETLKSILEKVGPVNSVYFPMDKFASNSGYACVNFENPDDAAKAIEELHGKLTFTEEECGGKQFIPHSPFYIQKAEKHKVRFEALKKQVEKLGLEGKQYKKNLYISNIPDSFSQEEIL
jgi:polyadenylate-binding protein